MDYDETLRWLVALPDFERTGQFADRPDLAPMRALLAQLGDPHLGRPTVHIAGSKGKGSTAVMAEAVLRAAGRRTGTYISPHLHRYNERIRIDGAPCDQEAFAEAMTSVRDAIAVVAPQFPGREFVAFDALTAAAFVVFREAGADTQVLEVGLGGTLDSTNVFHMENPEPNAENLEPRTKNQNENLEPGTENREPRTENLQPTTYNLQPTVVVLTPISLEHTAILGSTIPEIAAQKAGIITDGAAVVVAPQRDSALDVFRAVAAERGSSMIEVATACQMTRTAASSEAQEFKLKTARETYSARLPLLGRHQLDNAATAIIACEELTARAGFALTAPHVRDGLAKIAWPGRLEVLKRAPLVIVDGAHNGDSAKRMVAALREYFALSRAMFLFGTLAGKDVGAMADAVAPVADHVFATAWSHARAADPRECADVFRTRDVPVTAFGDVAQAYEAAVAESGGRGAVVAFGSIAFVAAVREYVLGIESDMIRLATTNPAR